MTKITMTIFALVVGVFLSGGAGQSHAAQTGPVSSVSAQAVNAAATPVYYYAARRRGYCYYHRCGYRSYGYYHRPYYTYRPYYYYRPYYGFRPRYRYYRRY